MAKTLTEKCMIIKKNQTKFTKAVKAAKKIYDKPSNNKKFTALVKEQMKLIK